jgi:hypothetical protein
VYIGILAVILVIVVIFFPETRGKTPEEIAFIFDKGVGAPEHALDEEHASSVSFGQDSKDLVGSEHTEDFKARSR